MSPPKTILTQIKKVIADFFWGVDNDGKKYHSDSWDTLAYPTNEDGIGIRLIEDVCKAFQFKHWWKFRTKKSLWSQFVRAKYCQRANHVAKKYDTGDSMVWRYLTRNRSEVESHIKWQINSGTCYFWWDNWLGNGALATSCYNISSLNNSKVGEFLIEGNWNESLVRQQVPAQLVLNILQTHITYQDGFFRLSHLDTCRYRTILYCFCLGDN